MDLLESFGFSCDFSGVAHSLVEEPERVTETIGPRETPDNVFYGRPVTVGNVGLDLALDFYRTHNFSFRWYVRMIRDDGKYVMARVQLKDDGEDIYFNAICKRKHCHDEKCDEHECESCIVTHYDSSVHLRRTREDALNFVFSNLLTRAPKGAGGIFSVSKGVTYVKDLSGKLIQIGPSTLEDGKYLL